MKKLLPVLAVSFLSLSLFGNPSQAQGYKNKIEISVAGAFQTPSMKGEPSSI